MLDVARHFFGLRDVERYIDLLALYKLNTLHLHLSDDQGWRIAIGRWPRLATVRRPHRGRGRRRAAPTRAQDRGDRPLRRGPGRHGRPRDRRAGPHHGRAGLLPRAGLRRRAPGRSTPASRSASARSARQGGDLQLPRRRRGRARRAAPGTYFHLGGDEAHSTTPADYARTSGGRAGSSAAAAGASWAGRRSPPPRCRAARSPSTGTPASGSAPADRAGPHRGATGPAARHGAGDARLPRHAVRARRPGSA